MIPVKDTYGQIESCDLVAVRLFDNNGNKMYEHCANSPSDLVEHLKEIHGMFKHYGKCVMWAATKKGHSANMNGAFKWNVSFADEKTVAEQVKAGPVSMAGQMKETMELLIMMKTAFGDNGNSALLQQQLLDAKLETFKAANSIELKKLEYAHDDPAQKWGFLTPAVMMGMGKSPDEIKNMMQLMAMGKVAGKNGEAILEVKNNKTSFESLQGMSNDQKNKKIEELEEKLFTLVSAEHFIMLLEMLIEKPERAAKAIAAAQNGLI